MKKQSLVALSLMLIAIGLSSCTQDSTSENDLQYKLVKYEKQSDGCEGLREDDCAKIKIEFPQITEYENSGVRDKINNSIKLMYSMNQDADPNSINFDEEMNSFISDYEEFITEFHDAFQSWFIEKTGDARLNRAHIFSVDYIEYSYTGGAHANTFVAFKNYKIKDGEEITLDEIISPDQQKELVAIAEVEFRTLKELTKEADLGQAGFWFENNEFYLNDNFLITDSTLVFYYNNYEITAYAFGPTELIIPFSKIKSLVGDASLIKPLLK